MPPEVDLPLSVTKALPASEPIASKLSRMICRGAPSAAPAQGHAGPEHLGFSGASWSLLTVFRDPLMRIKALISRWHSRAGAGDEGPTKMKHAMLGALGLGFLAAAPNSPPSIAVIPTPPSTSGLAIWRTIYPVSGSQPSIGAACGFLTRAMLATCAMCRRNSLSSRCASPRRAPRSDTEVSTNTQSHAASSGPAGSERRWGQWTRPWSWSPGGVYKHQDAWSEGQNLC